MSKYVRKQIQMIVTGSEITSWLQTEQAKETLKDIIPMTKKARQLCDDINNYPIDGVDLDLPTAELGDKLIEIEMALEKAWVLLFGSAASVVYDYMRGEVRTDRLTRDSMTDFIASAAPSRSHLSPYPCEAFLLAKENPCPPSFLAAPQYSVRRSALLIQTYYPQNKPSHEPMRRRSSAGPAILTLSGAEA